MKFTATPLALFLALACAAAHAAPTTVGCKDDSNFVKHTIKFDDDKVWDNGWARVVDVDNELYIMTKTGSSRSREVEIYTDAQILVSYARGGPKNNDDYVYKFLLDRLAGTLKMSTAVPGGWRDEFFRCEKLTEKKF